MYIPELYKNENPEDIRNFLKSNSFGILINQTEGKLWGTHIPLELDTNSEGKEVLFGHISKENPQWKGFEKGTEVLAIFSGPHSYISSSWYDHENVPTWNYLAVHVYGTIKIMEGGELLESLKELTNKYEAHSEKPVTVEGMSKSYLEKEMRGIVGVSIKITSVEASFKLSQNRDDKNHAEIVSQLKKRGDASSENVAQEMLRFRGK